MSGDLLFLLGEVKVLVEALFLFGLDDRFEFQTAKLIDDISRSETIACSTWVSTSQFLRRQVSHRLPHLILLRMYLQDKSKNQK